MCLMILCFCAKLVLSRAFDLPWTFPICCIQIGVRCGILIGSAMGGTSLQTSMENMDKLLKDNEWFFLALF